jgi:hypothetical protein
MLKERIGVGCMWSNLYRSRMADETTRADDRRAWTDEINRDTLRETDGHVTKENKVGVCMIVKEVVLSLQGVRSAESNERHPLALIALKL